MLASYVDYPGRFCFGKAIRTNILQVVEFVSSVLKRGPNAIEDYSYFSQTASIPATSTKHTCVGRIFEKSLVISCKDIVQKPQASLNAKQLQVIKNVLEESLLGQVKSLMSQLIEEAGEWETHNLNRLCSFNDLPLSMVAVNCKDLRWYLSSLNSFENDAANRSAAIRSIRGKVCCHFQPKGRAGNRNCNQMIAVTLRLSKGLEEFVTVGSVRDIGTWQCANFRRHLQKHKSND